MMLAVNRVGKAAMSWFALAVIIVGIGLPAISAAVYYWADLETRKGRGWNWLKGKGF
jgi:hypothetical protein